MNNACVKSYNTIWIYHSVMIMNIEIQVWLIWFWTQFPGESLPHAKSGTRCSIFRCWHLKLYKSWHLKLCSCYIIVTCLPLTSCVPLVKFLYCLSFLTCKNEVVTVLTSQDEWHVNTYKMVQTGLDAECVTSSGRLLRCITGTRRCEEIEKCRYCDLPRKVF